MHRAARRFLRFALDGVVYAFRALPFGLNLSPWAFTRIMDAVAPYHFDALKLPRRPLQKHPDLVVLEQDKFFLLERLSFLGFKVNRVKSDLRPSQRFIHLGMSFDTREGVVFLTDKRTAALRRAVSSLLGCRLATPRQLYSALGMCSAAADLIPLGRLLTRPILWALKDMGALQADWDSVLEIFPQLHEALRPWINATWLQSGVPLAPPIAMFSICTDASAYVWGAHLLPSYESCAGTWDWKNAVYTSMFWSFWRSVALSFFGSLA